VGCGRNERGWEGCAASGEQKFPLWLIGSTDSSHTAPPFFVWTVVVTRSYQDPPVPSSTWRPLPILDPPA